MYIKRACEETIKEIDRTFPVLLVTGPRQVGKSTMLEHLAEQNRKVVTLDDLEVRMLAKNDPGLFLQRYKPPVLIDEIQYAPELLPYIKIYVDKSKKMGEIWITGSQIFHMMESVSESLAGRVGIVNLLGLSNSEIDGSTSSPYETDPENLMKKLEYKTKHTFQDTFERIFTGAMPRFYNNTEIDREKYYNSYIDTYLQRDIRALGQVADIMTFYKFMVVVAARTGKPLIYEEIAQEIGVSAPTVKKWISILVSSSIIALVEPYSNNVLKRVTKMPMLHFLDLGLCAHLLKWTSREVLENGAMAGAFFESYVFSEIYKSYLNEGKRPPLYYYRDKDKKEIDLLIYENDTIYPIEIKKAEAPGKKAIKNFDVLDNFKKKIGTGNVICFANDLLPLDTNNWAVPVWLI